MRPKLRDERLYWRGRKIWCRVPGPNGISARKATGCTDETAASAVANGFEREYATPGYAAASAAQLGASLNDYFDSLRRLNRSASTIKIAEQKCGHFLRIWGHDLPMRAIVGQRVLDYMDQRAGEGVVAYTIKREVEHLTRVLELATFLGKFKTDIKTVIPPVIPGSPAVKTRAPSFDEVRRAMLELETPRAAHVAFIGATGSRLGESLRARRVDVDFESWLVAIRGSKTKGSASSVPITPISESLLRWALERAPGREVLFQPWGKICRDIAAACKRAGIPRFSPNDLRRAFGSWHRAELMVAGNTDKSAAELTSKMLRHTTDKLAQTTYAGLTAKAIGAAVTPKLLGVSSAYSLTAAIAPAVVQLREEKAEKRARPAGLEPATRGLEGLRQSLLDLLANKAVHDLFSGPVVRELYDQRDLGRNIARRVGGTLGPKKITEPWVHEATANLYALREAALEAAS